MSTHEQRMWKALSLISATAVARGEISGVSRVRKFGNNDEIDTNTDPEDVVDAGGIYAGFPINPTAELVTLAGGTTDVVDGVGARSVQIWGLDANWEEQTEVITPTGASKKDSVGLYVRVSRLKVLTAGSAGGNTGILAVAGKAVTANIFCSVPIGQNQTGNCATTIPAGKTGYMASYGVASAGGTAVTDKTKIQLLSRPFGQVFQVKDFVTVSTGGGGSTQDMFGEVLTEKTDIKVSVASVSVNNTAVSAYMIMYLVDDGVEL